MFLDDLKVLSKTEVLRMNYQTVSIAGLPVYSEKICGQKNLSSSCNSSIEMTILPDLGLVCRAERSISLHLLFKSSFVTAC